MEQRKLFTMVETAEIFRKSIRWLGNEVKRGKIHCRKVGGRTWMFTQEDIDNYVNSKDVGKNEVAGDKPFNSKLSELERLAERHDSLVKFKQAITDDKELLEGFQDSIKKNTLEQELKDTQEKLKVILDCAFLLLQNGELRQAVTDNDLEKIDRMIETETSQAREIVGIPPKSIPEVKVEESPKSDIVIHYNY